MKNNKYRNLGSERNQKLLGEVEKDRPWRSVCEEENRKKERKKKGKKKQTYTRGNSCSTCSASKNKTVQNILEKTSMVKAGIIYLFNVI